MAFTMNTSDYTTTLAGLLMAIAFPAIIISYLAMKHPTYCKTSWFHCCNGCSNRNYCMWLAFGFVSPDTYMIPQQVAVEEAIEEATPTGPIFAIEILEGFCRRRSPRL